MNVRHEQCPRCKSEGRDFSHDNLAIYEDENGGESAYCFSCGYTKPSKAWLEENGKLIYDYEEDENLKEIIEFDVSEVKKEYEFIDSAFRGINPSTYKYFGVMHKVGEDGNLLEQIYPTFKGKTLVGFKRRKLPKTFITPFGEVGKDVDFFGQFRFFNTTSRDILICAGEVDMLSAYQMLSEYTDRRNKAKGTSYEYIPVVSSTVGEVGTSAQAREQYDWLMKFNRVVICMDMDEAGREAVDKLAMTLPRGKMYVMQLSMKDANEMLEVGKEGVFIDCFYKAKQYTPAGVHASADLYQAALENTHLSRLTFPDFLKNAEDMFGGGWVKREICVIFAKTSVGKSLIVNNLTKHWIEHHPEETIGVMSLEATVDQYAVSILSSYLGVNLMKMGSDEREKYLKDEKIKDKIQKFTQKEDGSSKFYVLDDRGGSINVVKEKIEELIIKMGITTLIVDPFTDLQAGMDVSVQEEFSSWLKKITKEYQITLVLICHVRKTKDNSPLVEEDIIGSSTIMKSSAQTISLERDKLAEEEIDRNTTVVTIHKNRHFSLTGVACEVFYEWQTGKLYDKEKFLLDNPHMRPVEKETK